MKGYYILSMPLSETKESGISKKIQTQINTLNKANLETKVFFCTNTIITLFEKLKSKLYPFYFIKNIPKDFFNSDFYYFRYFLCTIPFIELLKKIKQKSNGIIIIELPTYPYHKEINKGLPQLSLLLDKVLSRQLKKYTDRIATYSKHQIIFDIPTIHIMNGIDCSLIPMTNKAIHEFTHLHLIAVANFYKWHGYDRLIEGLNNYYKQESYKKVYIHFVGDGPELNLYKTLVQQYNLSEYVFFHGLLFGEELSGIFNNADMAVCSLGGHRKDLYLSSELKSREYLAKGLPMVSSTKIDVLPPEYKYCFYVPEDDSPVNILDIVQFYNTILGQKGISEMSNEIRQFAERNCDISITMQPVIQYIAGDI